MVNGGSFNDVIGKSQMGKEGHFFGFPVRGRPVAAESVHPV